MISHCLKLMLSTPVYSHHLVNAASVEFHCDFNGSSSFTVTVRNLIAVVYSLTPCLVPSGIPEQTCTIISGMQDSLDI